MAIAFMLVFILNTSWLSICSYSWLYLYLYLHNSSTPTCLHLALMPKPDCFFYTFTHVRTYVYIYIYTLQLNLCIYYDIHAIIITYAFLFLHKLINIIMLILKMLPSLSLLMLFTRLPLMANILHHLRYEALANIGDSQYQLVQNLLYQQYVWYLA